MDKNRKRLSSSPGGLSILLSSHTIRIFNYICLIAAALIISATLSACSFRPVYHTGYKTHAPDIVQSLTIKGDKEIAFALKQALRGYIKQAQKGQYDLVITLNETISDDIVERSSQATRKRLQIKAVIKARHTLPPHIEKTRTRIYDTAYSDRRDELANMNQRVILRNHLVARIAQDIDHYLIYLSEKEDAHGTKESP